MQCFKVNSSALDKRLDPSPYSPTRTIALEKIKNTQCPKYCLKEVADFRRELVTNIPDDCTYIGLANIESNTGIYINSDSEKETISSAFRFYKGDVLFPKLRPYLNKVFLADFDGICSTEIHVLNAMKCSSEYLYSFLSSQVVVEQTSNLMTGNTLPRLQTEDVENLLIPIPSLSEQESIIDISKQAYEYKLKKEQEAEAIINSANNIILDLLDIKNYSTYNKNAFSVRYNNVKHNRLDVYGYQPVPRAVIKAIMQSKYQETIVILNSLILENFAGDWGEDIEKDLNGNYSICNVIRNKNFNNVYNIDYEDIAQRKILNTKKEKILLKKGDILIEKSGGSPQQPVGRVAYIDKDIDNYVFSNFLQCIRINSELCDPEYLFIYLRTIYKLNYMKYIQSQTTGIINLLMDDFLNIPIILLKDKDAQREIVDKYNEMHNKAKQLQEEAKDEFKKAKAEVEKMILGEE